MEQLGELGGRGGVTYTRLERARDAPYMDVYLIVM